MEVTAITIPSDTLYKSCGQSRVVIIVYRVAFYAMGYEWYSATVQLL